MDLIPWNEKFCFGVPEIDRDHEALVRGINDLYNAIDTRKDREDVKRFFGNVIREMTDHFANEDRIMIEHHYSDQEAHRLDHQRLLTDIQDIAKDFADGVYDYDPEKEMARRIADWFLEHTQTHDARLCKTIGHA